MTMAANIYKTRITNTGNERNTAEDNFPIAFQFLPLPLLNPKKYT
jgi:hypothetical protein